LFINYIKFLLVRVSQGLEPGIKLVRKIGES